MHNDFTGNLDQTIRNRMFFISVNLKFGVGMFALFCGIYSTIPQLYIGKKFPTTYIRKYWILSINFYDKGKFVLKLSKHIQLFPSLAARQMQRMPWQGASPTSQQGTSSFKKTHNVVSGSLRFYPNFKNQNNFTSAWESESFGKLLKAIGGDWKLHGLLHLHSCQQQQKTNYYSPSVATLLTTSGLSRTICI